MFHMRPYIVFGTNPGLFSVSPRRHHKPSLRVSYFHLLFMMFSEQPARSPVEYMRLDDLLQNYHPYSSTEQSLNSHCLMLDIFSFYVAFNMSRLKACCPPMFCNGLVFHKKSVTVTVTSALLDIVDNNIKALRILAQGL